MILLEGLPLPLALSELPWPLLCLTSFLPPSPSLQPQGLLPHVSSTVPHCPTCTEPPLHHGTPSFTFYFVHQHARFSKKLKTFPSPNHVCLLPPCQTLPFPRSTARGAPLPSTDPLSPGQPCEALSAQGHLHRPALASSITNPQRLRSPIPTLLTVSCDHGSPHSTGGPSPCSMAEL